MDRKKAPEQPADASRIWFMGFPTWESVVVTTLVLWAAHN